MKKEIIITIFIIVAIIIAHVLTQNYTKKSVEIVNGELEILKEMIMKKEENEKINKQIEQVKQKWDTRHEVLAYYIEHDEIEKVETQIYEIQGNSEVEEYSKIIPELEKCVFILEHIQDKMALNVKNIF